MPNIQPFCMPKWGIEMTEGTLAEWKVAEGDAFKRGEMLCLIETDKITNEVEAEFELELRPWSLFTNEEVAQQYENNNQENGENQVFVGFHLAIQLYR